MTDLLARIRARHAAGLSLGHRATKASDRRLLDAAVREHGSWRAAVEAAGLPYRGHKITTPEAALLRELREARGITQAQAGARIGITGRHWHNLEAGRYPVTEEALEAVERVRPLILWDRQALGDDSDQQIARRLGVSRRTVRRERLARGIPIRGVDWSAQPLGEVSDYEIARRLGTNKTTVRRARTARGIPPCNEPREWHDIDWHDQPYDAVTDRTLAERLGVPRTTVAYHRRHLGRPMRARDIDWEAQPFGLVSDAELAERLGCHERTVTNERERRHIPPRRERYRARCAADHSTEDRA